MLPLAKDTMMINELPLAAIFLENLCVRKNVSMIPKKVMIDNKMRELEVNPIVQPFRKGAAFLL